MKAHSSRQLEYPDVITESILHHLGTNKSLPVNITQITTTLGYSKQALHAAADILKGQHMYFVTENVLALRSTIDVSFDAVTQIIISLESSLNGTNCLTDFGLIEVQNALQVVMDVCISSNWEKGALRGVNDLQTFSNETVASSVYVLSSATKSFINSASNFVQEVSRSKEIVDKNVISGVQATVETALTLIDIVLRGLKTVRDMERVFEHPSLIKLQFTLGKLTSQQLNLIEGITDDIISSFTQIVNGTQTNMEKLPLIMDANIAILLKSISSILEEIPLVNGTVEPIKSLQSALRDMSISVHSTNKNSDFSIYSLDTSSQNLIASITYLTNSVAILPSNLLFHEFHELIQPNFQANLLYLTTSIRTLNDELTLIVRRRLIDLICTSSSVEKTNLKKRLMELESSMKNMILIYEKVIKSSIETVRNHMSLASEILTHYDIAEDDTDVHILFRDTKLLVSDLDRILSNNTSTMSTIENAFTVCTKAFEKTARISNKSRKFLNKSIKQINKYLM